MNIECNFDLKIAVERQRSFKDFTIEDILSFLDRFRRAESVDPCINGYAHIITTDLSPFFNWLYYLDIEPNTRQKPPVIDSLSKKEW